MTEQRIDEEEIALTQQWRDAMKRQAYSIIFNTHHRRRPPVAERCLPSRLDRKRERHMRQFYLLHAQEAIRAVAERWRECAEFSVVRGAVAETRVATQKAIAESRESMAQADAVIARKYRRLAKDLRSFGPSREHGRRRSP
jgi:hypothetical protein